jgi:Uma2 family endonuclease
MSPPPTSEHQHIVSTLNFYFFQFLKDKECRVFPAPFDVRLPNTTTDSNDKIINVVHPDLTVICYQSKIDDKGCKGSPDLVVEVVSGNSVTRDLHEISIGT